MMVKKCACSTRNLINILKNKSFKYNLVLSGNTMEKQILLNVAIKEEPEGGFSVVCTDLDVASQGETINEAMENIKDAVELYLESAEELDIMDEVFEKLGLTKEEFKKEILVPKIFKTEIPIKLAA